MQVVKRVVAALSTAALVILGLCYAPLNVILPVMILLVALVHLEFSQMVARKHPILVKLGVLSGVAIMLYKVYYDFDCGYLLIPIVFLLALRVLSGKCESPIRVLAVTLLGILYIPVMLSLFIRVPVDFGVPTLIYLIAIVKFSDMGGFAVGMLCGKHKMCPSISPKKSWEGLGGSVLGSCLMSAAFMPITHFALPKALAFGVAAALIGTAGDLIESRMKRECGVKDSATFMPAGMGGFLDMFDSLIFAPALLTPFI